MWPDLDRSSTELLPQQIKQALADRIRSGLLREGDRLPTVRTLAAELAVSPVTVMQAYAALEAAGLVVREHGKGVFVRRRAGRAEAAGGGSAPPAAAAAWQRRVTDYIPRALSWALLRSELPPGTVPMHTATIETSLLPVADLVNHLRHAVLDDPTRLGVYSPVAGAPGLCAAAAAYLRRDGLRTGADQILITQGAQQGIDLVARTFLGPGDGVAMESPAYPPAIDAFRARGVRIHPIPVDAEGMRTDLLAQIPGLRLVYLVPTFQNPTGAVLSRRRRAELFELARQRDLLILEDDPWREVAFGPAPPPPLKSQDAGGHVIYLKSFSKILAVGVRLGVLVADGRLFERLLAAKSIADQGTALLPQLAVEPLLGSPRLERHLRRMRAALRERRDAVLAALAQGAPRGVRWTRPEGGLSIWVSLPRGLDAEQLLAQAEERGISFAPGTGFFPGDPELHHLRLSYGGAGAAELARGTAALCAVLRAALAK